MSIEVLKTELDRFLASPNPEVVCIKGKWGVGKTHGWNALLREAQRSKKIALASYSYVSLFGLDSLDQLKYAIFENSVSADDIGVEPTVESFRMNALGVAKRTGRKSLAMLAILPAAKNAAAALQSLAFLSVNEKVICIDDLERKGAHLSMKDVLGLVSHLREHKRCKVVLILNDGMLDGTDRADFERFHEKVIDASLDFAPSARESVAIALTEKTPMHEQLAAGCMTLGISNIRVIRKIERLVSRVAPLLVSFDEKVLYQAVQSLTVLGWSSYDLAAAAPTLEFLRTKRGQYVSRKASHPTEQEKGWDALLDEFGFSDVDEFDLELLEGIQKGYFNEPALAVRGAELDARFKNERAHGSLQDAWRLFHDSFEDNEAEVVARIYKVFRDNIQHVTPLNLSGTVRMLKDLGAPEKAAEALQFYMQERNEGRNFYDLVDQAFGSEVDDPDVRAAFDKKYASFEDKRPPKDILRHIAKNSSWSPDDIAVLVSLSVDDFYRMFRETTGGDLNRIVRACLDFEGIVDRGEALKTVSAKAKEALTRLGKESRINRRRVKKYGIEISD